MPAVVVPLIASAITALAPAAGAIAFGTVTWATLGANLLVAGITIGVGVALSSRNRQQGALPQLPQSQTLTTRANAVANRFYGFGVVSDGGDYVFWEVENGWLGYAIIIDCGPIDGIEAIYCDNELLPLSTGAAPYAAGDPVTSIASVDFGEGVQWPNDGLKWAQVWTYYWDGKQTQQGPIGDAPAIFVEFRNATDAGRPSTLLREFFGDHPLNVRPWYGETVINWSANHKACGLSMLYATATKFKLVDRLNVYPEGWPKFRVVRRAALVYDPREETHDFDDPSTWEFSQNPALGRAWHAAHEDGYRRPYSKINWESFATAADDCDRLVNKFGGGTEAWARCGAQWNTAMERREVEDIFDISCDGTAYEDPDGKLAYWIFQDVVSDTTFTLRDISSIVEDVVGGPYAANSKFVGVYIEPRSNYQRGNAPEVIDEDAFAVVGDFTKQLQHDGVHSFSQSYRLAYRAMRRTNVKRRLTLIGSWTFMRARRKRKITLDCAEVGISGDFWIDGPIQFESRMHNWTMQVVELEADAFDDVVPPRDPISADLETPIIEPGDLPTPSTPTLSQATLSGDEYVQASVTAPENDTLIAQFRIRHVETPVAEWIAMADVLGQWERQYGPVTIGEDYEVEAWFVSPTGQTSASSATATITIT